MKISKFLTQKVLTAFCLVSLWPLIGVAIDRPLFSETPTYQVPDLQQLLRLGATVTVTFKEGVIGGMSTSAICPGLTGPCHNGETELCVVESEQEVFPGETYRLNIVANHESGTTMLLSNASGANVRMQCSAFAAWIKSSERETLGMIRKPIYDYRVLNRFSGFEFRVRYNSKAPRL